MDTLEPRRKTDSGQVGSLAIGSDHRIRVQSMSTTVMGNLESPLRQLALR